MKNVQIRCFQNHMGEQNHWKTTRPNEKVLLRCIALFGLFGWLRFGQFGIRALLCAVAAVLRLSARASRRSPGATQRDWALFCAVAAVLRLSARASRSGLADWPPDWWFARNTEGVFFALVYLFFNDFDFTRASMGGQNDAFRFVLHMFFDI